jgi:UPF0716 protein FxsA
LFRVLFVLFLTVPLVELYVLIQVGGFIGPVMTVILCLLTAALGAALLRYQGLQTIARIQQKTNAGEMPAIDLLEGAILLFSGLLLLTPGFVTDIIGFLCLTPAIRTWAATGMLHKHFQGATKAGSHHTVIVEGEFWEEEGRHSQRPLPRE